MAIGVWCPAAIAPTGITWGYDNRSVAVRVPNGPPEAMRLEHRIAGADAHPHLVLAAILAGMLDGLEAGIEPPEPLTAMPMTGRRPVCPRPWRRPSRAFSSSPFIERTFGAEYRHVYSVMKEEELAAFSRTILPLEYETYL